MMIKLLALAKEDGWAFIRTSEHLYLCRPPYNQALQRVNEKVLTRAVLTNGFSAVDKEFSTWEDLIRFLNEGVMRSRRERGQNLNGFEVGRELLAIAPRDQIERLINRVKAELLPQGHWSHAKALLCDLLTLDVTRSDSELNRRTAQLLHTTLEMEAKFQRGRSEILTQDAIARCGLALSLYGESEISRFAEQVAQRGGQPLAFA
jgi:hypothetical protein